MVAEKTEEKESSEARVKSEALATTWPGVVGIAVKGTLEFLTKVTLAVVKGPNVVLLTAMPLAAYVTLVLTGNKDASAGMVMIAKLFVSTASSGFFAVGGWICAGLLLAIGAPVVWLQHSRIKKQGALLSNFKKNEDPKRLSSLEDDKLDEYAGQDKDAILAKYDIVDRVVEDN